jgi:mono/diheme cytochrome c family protein
MAVSRGVQLTLAFVLLLAVSIGGLLFVRYFQDTRPPEISDPLEHFKYGSIGAEVNGLPYAIWRVLPQLVPEKTGANWRNFGFLWEPGRTLPVGLSVRRWKVDRVGFNCAACHTARIEGSAVLLLGAPAESLKLQDYLLFLASLGTDPRFNADAIINAMKADDRSFDFIDELVNRYYIIPTLKKELVKLGENSSWMQARAPHGPGRTDAGNPWRHRFGLNPGGDQLSGTTDFPHIWAQSGRGGRWAHWDGNNASLKERNLSAALAGGATPDSLDHASIERVAAWSVIAPAPRFPAPVSAESAQRGRAIFSRERCDVCHDPAGAQFGQVTEIGEIGTDRDRFDVFSPELLRQFASVGEGKDWQFRHYRKSGGYVNLPLDGVWARAPYLHNGSVPTIEALLRPAAERPRQFYRGCTKVDTARVGFACTAGFLFDTGLRGNSNAGHEYGTAITQSERRDLVEYLKTR